MCFKDFFYSGDDSIDISEYDFSYIAEEHGIDFSRESSIALVKNDATGWYPSSDRNKFEPLCDLKHALIMEGQPENNIIRTTSNPDAQTIEMPLIRLGIGKQEVCLTIEQYLCNRAGLFSEQGRESESWCIQVMYGLVHSTFLLHVYFVDRNDCTLSSRYVNGSENVWLTVFQEICDLFRRPNPTTSFVSVEMTGTSSGKESNLEFYSHPCNVGLIEDVIECILDADHSCQINSLQQLCDLSLDPELHSLLLSKGAVHQLIKVVCNSVNFSESGTVIADTHLIRLLACGLSSLENFFAHKPAQMMIVESDPLRKVLNYFRNCDRLRLSVDMAGVVVSTVSENLWRKMSNLCF